MVIINSFVNAQNIEPQKLLDEVFYDYRLIDIDEDIISSKHNRSQFFNLKIDHPFQDGAVWNMELSNSGIISPDYVARRDDGERITISQDPVALPTKGYLVDDGQSAVYMTFNKNYVMGAIHQGGEIYYIEPSANFGLRTDRDYVVYKKSDLKPTRPVTCGVDEAKHRISRPDQEDNTHKRTGDCYEVEYAIGNDFLMVQEFGSVANAENHAISITNLVQGNYDNEFPDAIQIVIVEQFTPSTSGADPWTNSTDSGDLLNSFRNWAPGGFFSDFDVASLWSDRNFDGSTIGLAYVGAVCTSFKYNVLQNYTSSSDGKRVMTAHELGHNFGSSHDPSGSPTIMAPAVNFTNDWSQQSINAIEDYYLSVSCLGSCVPINNDPPVAGFEVDLIENCVIGQADFTSTSTGSNLTYDWDFEGGSPATSGLENPIVNYDQPGTFSVTLTVTNNNGSDMMTMTDVIVIEEDPILNFTIDVNEQTVTITNNSEFTTFQEWDFGDGTTSNEFAPIHTYQSDGDYTILLYAENSCGSQTITQFVSIATAPQASFTSDVNSGCAPLTVNYMSTSSDNSDTYNWLFDGGSPNVSFEENPSVTYSIEGTYDVSLTVSNDNGNDQSVVADFVTVLDVRDAQFTYNYVDDFTVSFIDAADDGLGGYFWDFGDGNTSTEQNPIHTYTQTGDYIVSFSKSNNCGDDTDIQNVSITTGPTASFTVDGNNIGCAPHQFSFVSNSLGDDLQYNWSFPGGNPSTSTEANPDVTYTQEGVYDVTLEVTNDLGSDVMVLQDAVIVLSEPEGNITYQVSGTSVVFSSSYDLTNNFNYDFGNGTSSSNPEPFIDYNDEGIYSVTVSISNDCGTVQENFQINLFTEVTADFNASDTEICTDDTVTFDYTGSDNATTFAWSFPGGSPATSSAENPVVTYANSGTYDVTLIASNPSASDTETVQGFIVVGDAPTADFSFENVDNGVQFTSLATDADSFMWSFGDGNSSSQENPLHNYASENNYDVTLEVSNSCGSDTYVETINNYTGLEADFTTTSTSGCIPFVVELFDNSNGTVVSYDWTIIRDGDIIIESSEEQNPTFTLTESGFYGVQLVVSNGSFSDTKYVVMYLHALTIPSVDISFSRDERTFDFSPLGGAYTNLVWDFGDGNTSTEDNPTHTYDEDGSYTVTLTKTNDCGNNTATISVDASASPTAAFNFIQSSKCAPAEVHYVSESTESVSYDWAFEGGAPATSTEMNPTVTYDTPGEYNVTLVVTNDAGSETLVRENLIKVFEEQEEDFEVETSQLDVTLNYPGPGIDVVLDLGDGTTSEFPGLFVDYVHTYTEEGTYIITLSGTDICGDFEISKEVTVMTTSTEDIDDVFGEVLLYPNPTTSDVHVSMQRLISDIEEIQITDLLGRRVRTIKDVNSVVSGNEIVLNLSGLNPGTYVISMRSGTAKSINKLIKF